MNPSPPDTVTWTISRAMLPEFSMSGIAYQQALEQVAQLQTENLRLAAELTQRDSRIETLTTTNQLQSQKLREALARIDALVNTPPAVPFIPAPPLPQVPGEVKPRPWIPMVGMYVEDERAVNDAKQAKERADALIPVMVYAAENSQLTDFILFCNPEELKLGTLPAMIRILGKRWWQSPVQNDFVPGGTDQSKFIARLDALHKAGMYGCFIDDAQNIPAKDMPVLLDLIRDHCPGAPVVCSFAAAFDDSAYPKSRYIDSRQWFLKNVESEGVWFQRWETAQDAQIYTADCWKRDSGFMHTPARIESMIKTALPFVQGLVFYSLVNVGKWNHVESHKEATAKDPKAKTVFSVMAAGAAEYMKLNAIVAQAD